MTATKSLILMYLYMLPLTPVFLTFVGWIIIKVVIWASFNVILHKLKKKIK